MAIDQSRPEPGGAA